MEVGTRVYIKSLKKYGTVVEVDGFPYNRVAINWPFVNIDNYDHPFRTGEFFDPENLEIQEKL